MNPTTVETTNKPNLELTERYSPQVRALCERAIQMLENVIERGEAPRPEELAQFGNEYTDDLLGMAVFYEPITTRDLDALAKLFQTLHDKARDEATYRRGIALLLPRKYAEGIHNGEPVTDKFFNGEVKLKIHECR